MRLAKTCSMAVESPQASCSGWAVTRAPLAVMVAAGVDHVLDDLRNRHALAPQLDAADAARCSSESMMPLARETAVRM